MEEKFRDWLVQRGNAGAAKSYPTAIHLLSEHYSAQTGTPTNIYSITDQRAISEIAHDYSKRLQSTADQGAFVSSCYVYDEATGQYKVIEMGVNGDWNYENLSPGARELADWLETLNDNLKLTVPRRLTEAANNISHKGDIQTL